MKWKTKWWKKDFQTFESSKVFHARSTLWLVACSSLSTLLPTDAIVFIFIFISFVTNITLLYCFKSSRRWRRPNDHWGKLHTARCFDSVVFNCFCLLFISFVLFVRGSIVVILIRLILLALFSSFSLVFCTQLHLHLQHIFFVMHHNLNHAKCCIVTHTAGRCGSLVGRLLFRCWIVSWSLSLDQMPQSGNSAPHRRTVKWLTNISLVGWITQSSRCQHFGNNVHCQHDRTFA